MYDIDPTRIDLAQEFKRKPFGRHSAELQRVLNRMRSEPFEGHFVLLRDGRFGPWKLAQLGRRPYDPVSLTGHIFDDRNKAEWAVFKLRWKRITGKDLPLE